MKGKIDKFEGFTLIECLVALLVVSYMLMMFSLLIQVIKQVQQETKLNSRKEFGIFLLQLEQETIDYELEAVIDNKIFFRNNKNVQVQVRQVGARLDKKENGGTHPLLTQIKSFNAKQIDYAVEIEVVFSDDKICKGKWIQTKT